jgi:iron complex outermembrane recepter protein
MTVFFDLPLRFPKEMNFLNCFRAVRKNQQCVDIIFFAGTLRITRDVKHPSYFFGRWTMKKFVLLSATAFSTLFLNQHAFAQDATQDDEPVAEQGEYIVTATLRNENLQDVPIAVSAFNAEALEKAGVKDVKSLDQVSASFNMNSTQTESGGTTVRIRGVGTTGNNTGLESAVGIFLDGVYLSRPGIAMGDLMDVQQIELLRGPQGTLFGRNTSAGAVSIKTAKPNLNNFEGFANATYGNYDLMSVQGGVSAPLAEGTMGFRLSGAYRKRDGYIRNVVGGESNNKNRYLLRGQLYWEPNADLNVRIIGDYSKSDEKCCDAIVLKESSYATVPVAFVGGAPITSFGANGLPNNGGITVSGFDAFKDGRSSNNFELTDKIKQWGMSGTIEYDLGGAQLTAITGYRDFNAQSTQETDLSTLRVFSVSTPSSASTNNTQRAFTELKTFSQELRVAGSLGDKFDYLVGGYFVREKIREVQAITLGSDFQAYISAPLTSVGVPGPNSALNIFAGGVSASGNYANNLFTQNARNFSVFTNNTFRLTDALAVNFGVRYSSDRKRGAFSQLSASSPACLSAVSRIGLLSPGFGGSTLPGAAAQLTCFPFTTQANALGAATASVPFLPITFDRVFKDNELVYTGKLTYEASSNINTYLSYTHGYKSGGFNLDPAAAAGGANPAFKSEKVNAFEFGLKTKLIDNALTANLAVFHQDLTDFQVLEFTGVQFQTFNVPKAKSTGFELETIARLSNEFSFNTSITYSDARYPKSCAPASFPVIVRQLCGQDLTNAPKWVGIAGFDYTKEFGSNMAFGFNTSVRLESDRRTSTQAVEANSAGVLIPNALDVQDGNAKVNFRASVGEKEGKWAIEFWGQNIFDVATRNVTFNTPLRGIGALPGPLNADRLSVSRAAFKQEPRTYGLTVRTKF